MRDNNKSAGICFCDLLGIVFIVLKLVGVIDWPWILVLAPILIPLAIAVVYILVVVIKAIVEGWL